MATRRSRSASRSSASGRASCGRSRSRTGCSPAAGTPTRATRRTARARSSSRSTAGRPPRPASACRCRRGRRRRPGFDLALTELLDSGGHRFLVEAGTSRGAEVLAEAGASPAPTGDVFAAEAVTERTTASMGRSMPAIDLRDLLYDNLEHPRWDDVAAAAWPAGTARWCARRASASASRRSAAWRSGRAGRSGAERQRSWDSCFTLDHSYLHGGPVRTSTRSRYRQWMTHKLATWQDQFGTSGCVGCGRCIAWCPVGIDITEEVGAIAADD